MAPKKGGDRLLFSVVDDRRGQEGRKIGEDRGETRPHSRAVPRDPTAKVRWDGQGSKKGGLLCGAPTDTRDTSRRVRRRCAVETKLSESGFLRYRFGRPRRRRFGGPRQSCRRGRQRCGHGRRRGHRRRRHGRCRCGRHRRTELQSVELN